MSNIMRIGLIMQGGRTWAGGAEYIKNIILALSTLPPEAQNTFTVKLICSKNIEPELLESITPFLESIHYLEDQQPFTILNRLRWKAQRTLLNRKSPRLDAFLHSLNLDFVYPHFTTDSKKYSFQSCPWIPDFQHKYLPELFSPAEIQLRDETFGQISELSRSVVVSSKSAKDDFRKFFPSSDCIAEVLQFKTVSPESYYSADSISIQKKYYLPDRFFIISNQFWRHKNHMVVFEALKMLHNQSINPIVVCTGHMYDYRHPSYVDEVLQVIHTYDLAQQVCLLGMIPRFDQIQLMRRAIAVIQPSSFEGWSTVVEDARCLGKTILLSDLSVHLEQSPPNSVIFDCHSPDQLAGAIAEKWESLSSGPDFRLETQAKRRRNEEIQDFGKRFIEIARLIQA